MTKEEKRFMHKNPLCFKCMDEGHYRSSKHVVLNPDGSRSTLCDKHYEERKQEDDKR